MMIAEMKCSGRNNIHRVGILVKKSFSRKGTKSLSIGKGPFPKPMKHHMKRPTKRKAKEMSTAQDMPIKEAAKRK